MPSRLTPVGESPPDAQQEATAAVEVRTWIAGRYEILSELGRGGMAYVYRVRDSSTGSEVALKQLTPAADPKRAYEATMLFEREFHTLTQLSHPRVTRVYDFGIDASGPYYTMELLDGGDLRERSPLPWRDACELIFDVCSSLALMHSRRLVHRDVSPRNVRCTRDGHAKLIDFGAMVPMGATARLVGTAAFVAPEALHGSILDARTDLFSLGSTLYFALTGQLVFPARDFSQLLDAWSEKPAPPSSIVSEIPAALDQLVLSLVSLEPALRPRSAFEVMQRLATVANIRREEPLSVSKAYLVTPSLVGRDEPLAAFCEHLEPARHGRGCALLFSAATGCGRSRMLDACALVAKMRGACVLRANATAGSSDDFAVARALVTQLLEALPERAPLAARGAGVFDILFEPARSTPESASEPANDNRTVLRSFARPASERPQLQKALLKWFVQVSKRQLLVVFADDADRIDEPSMALLAALAERAKRKSVVVVASSVELAGARAGAGLEALRVRCETHGLRALSLQETEFLLSSVFGDAPNLALVSARIHAVAAGNPQQTMLLAHYLVDRGVIRYEDGSWSLPAQLTAAELPTSSDEAFRVRARELSPLAKRLAEAQALSGQGCFAREDYAMLAPDAELQALDDAIEELLAQEILASDGRSYTVAHWSAAELLCSELSERARIEHHAALAILYERSGRPAFAVARQCFLAQQYDRGFDRMIPILRAAHERTDFMSSAGLTIREIGRTLAHALQVACELQRPLAEQHELRHWLVISSVADDDAWYWQAAPAWLAQLERDSGLCDWRSLDAIRDPGQRLMTALQAAAKRHAEAAESEKVYAPDRAIRLLVYYVAISIAIGSRTLDPKIMLPLPGLLEPLAPLSPLVAAIHQNAQATCESACYRQTERACARWIKVYEQLGEIVAPPDPQLIQSIRYAIAFGVGNGEASMGLQSALRWAELLDREPMQRVNAMYLRKVICLQQGDLEGAERCRKQAELLALQSSTRQMFTSLLMLEIVVHYAALDLAGVKEIAEKIAVLAARNPGWVPFQHLAEGHYQRLRGDLEAARQAYERCLALATPDPNEPTRSIAAWPVAAAAYVDTLVRLDRAPEAKACAERALAECERRELGVASHEIVRALALAEAKLGDYAKGASRLEALLDAQRALGVSGLNLGASYEARARVAIWAGDRTGVERFARLTAEQYRHGRGSPLGVRYERLMGEARGAGVTVLPARSAFESTMFGNTEIGARDSVIATIAESMIGAHDAAERGQRALKLLCDARGARGGHLFLDADGELRLAASYAADAPDAALERAVADFWSHQFDEIDPDTAQLSDGGSTHGYSTLQWTDLRGTTYQPMLVSGKVGREVANAGVALLIEHDSGTTAMTSMPLVAELAGFLVRSRARAT